MESQKQLQGLLEYIDKAMEWDYINISQSITRKQEKKDRLQHLKNVNDWNNLKFSESIKHNDYIYLNCELNKHWLQQCILQVDITQKQREAEEEYYNNFLT